MKAKKKKPSKRSKLEYPGLVKEVHLKNRQELIDQDYIHKLSPKEKKWLSNFNEEYVGSNFKHAGKPLHTRKKQRREAYNRNNARNRDLFAALKVNNMLKDDKSSQAIIEDRSIYNPEDVEDNLITLIDTKKRGDFSE